MSTNCLFDCLAVTKCDVTLNDGSGVVKGTARVVLNDQLLLTGLTIVDGSNGLYVGYPNVAGSGDFMFYPLTKDLAHHIEICVLEKYYFEELTTKEPY